MPVVTELTRGSHRVWGVYYESDDGSPIDLTGWSADLIDVSPALADLISVEITAAAAGLAEVTLKAAMLDLRSNHTWRLRLTPEGEDGAERAQTLSLVTVRVV